jgi:hypothetical protein
MAINPTKPGILPSCLQVFEGKVTRLYFLKSARVSALFLIKYKAIRLRTRVKLEYSLLKGTPNVRLGHCLPERAIDLEEEIGRRLIVFEKQYVLSSSLHDSKYAQIKFLEDVCRMRWPSYDSDPGVTQDSRNFFADVGRAVIR